MDVGLEMETALMEMDEKVVDCVPICPNRILQKLDEFL